MQVVAGVERGLTHRRSPSTFVIDSDVVFRRCTISDNESGVDASGDREGGGISVHAQSFATSAVIIEHCIVSYNSRGEAIFCDIERENYGLAENSPCGPKASLCGLIGALGVSCTTSGVTELTWGKLTALYRR
jgi:hypothetical protein